MKAIGRIKDFSHTVAKLCLYLLLKLPIYRKWIYAKEKKKVKGFTHEIEDDIIRASRILKQINAKMVATGWSRQKRRQFWRDFQKNDLFREDMFDSLVKDKAHEERPSGSR